MAVPILQIDAFTSRPFSGNPAAVCLLDAPAPEPWMQALAAEMNLSETAFLTPREDGFSLRWFTPRKEVRLCGHATLASAHALWETGTLPPGATACFHTLSGLLTARQRDGWIELDFPARQQEPSAPPPGLLEAAFGLSSLSALSAAPAPVYIGRREELYLVEVQDEAVVRARAPDFSRLGALPVRGLIVTARSDAPEFDFVSRYFAPAVGINEDPVTGSAHCMLTPYWAAKLGKPELNAYQASARGGVLRVRLAGERVQISGQAVTVLSGTLSARP